MVFSVLIIQQTECNQSAYSYKTNQLPFSYNAHTSINHVAVHPYHQQSQQQTYLSLPYLPSYAGNLRKKPTTSSAAFVFNKNTKHKHHAINSNGNNNMHMYSKRYKRYPPFQTMPEIPIKKAIGRYLPNAPMYSMGVMTPSILLPLYVAPAKATTRIILKPAVLDLASTSPAKIKKTKLNKSLILNYLRMANDNKSMHTTAMPTTTTTTPSTVSTSIGNNVVDASIKFYDTPYSATNIQQQKQHYYNNNFATHFLLPVMPATTATTTTTTTTAGTTTEHILKRMPASFYERGQIVNDKGDYEFLPTWYSYGKPQAKKYSNFFTIEDAITPYKPIETLTIGYQPSFYYENTQTENYAHVKPTSQALMQFSPMQATTTTEMSLSTANTTTTSSSTVSSLIAELSREASKWNLFADEKHEDATSTMGALKVEEIALTSSAPITARNMSKLERAMKMAENVEPHRIRTSTTAATNISRKSIKKVLRTKSFFDDWFADDNLDESVESTTPADKILTTTTMPSTEMDNRLHKLKWPTKRRQQNISRATISTSTSTTTTTPSTTRTVLKKPRKKYGNPKPRKVDSTSTDSMKANATTKFVKRIKKLVRVRPTLFSILKLQNKNIDEQIDRPLQAMDMTPTQIIQNSMDDNEPITTTTTTPVFLQYTTPTTSTTTTTTTSKAATENVERTRFGGMQRKRGRHSYNSQMNQTTTEATFNRNERQERIEANKKSRQTHARQRTATTATTTTTTTTTTSEPKNHRHATEFLPVLKNYKESSSSSTTMESAIMKIARNKRINNILENLLVTSSTSSTPLSEGSTEYPQLPIELYFQKIKAGFK